VCERFKIQNRPPTVFLASEREGILAQWRERLAQAKGQAEQEARVKAHGAALHDSTMWRE
jgi:hypothetical protein